MSKQKKTYDTAKLFQQGLLAFGRALGFFSNPMISNNSDQIHYSKEEDKRRRKNHAKFKAQRTARKLQRRLQP